MLQSRVSGAEVPVKKNKAVIDTSVLISAFAFGGIPMRAVKKAFVHTAPLFIPLISPDYLF